MPVSDPDVIDSIGVNTSSDRVMMNMWEERDWTELEVQLRDLEKKVNSYLDYVLGGQLNESPEYVGKPIDFQIFLQFRPPDQAKPHFRALASHLSQLRIGFTAFLGPYMWSPRFDWDS